MPTLLSRFGLFYAYKIYAKNSNSEFKCTMVVPATTLQWKFWDENVFYYYGTYQ
jgi:hypothetical protein